MKNYPLFPITAILGLALAQACTTTDDGTVVDDSSSSDGKADSASKANDALAAITHNMAVVQDGWNTFDADEIIGETTSTVSFISPYGDRVDGRDALRTFVQAAFVPNTTHEFEILHLRLVTSNVALTDELVTVTGYTDPTGNPLPPVEIHAVTLWVRSNGNWLASDIRNHVYLPPLH